MRNTIVSIIAILLGLIAGGLLMLAIGSNPIEGYNYLLQGALINIERIGNTLATATPLIFTGLAVAFAFRTGLFNIGAAGQMLAGGLAATAIALTFEFSRPVMLILMILGGLLAGALFALIPGILKARFNVHEVVSTIMMNWIAYWSVYYIVPGYFKGPSLETESQKLPDEYTLRAPFLSDMFDGSYINYGIFLGIIAVIIIAFIIDKTTLGFELKAVGFNRHAAEYAGMRVNRNIILSMLISGALAGLGGVALYTGNASSMQIGLLPSQGYDGIAVALLGANNPIGVFFAAILFGILYSGTGFMNAMTEIPPELANTIIAIIIYFAATSVLIHRIIDKFKRSKANRPEHKKGEA
ncbi:ABC transporter permease [Robertmurraya andreesenii]|uniref:Simple sugar transport system permease protein n=1 Tax=Anoxybacillus andreesenii TaxID=1325932 RepID=A0ABT9V734_9BACL|nr:ABC transporter permease [Robertmurraya andreesenii]MDQ0156751.1 simple sugar transport system permease protein [Robertmurraya andreesenii]